jgi:hypothetical protein
VIINFQLLFWCVVLGGAYLLIADLIWNAFERLVPTFKNFPRELIDAKGVVWFVCNGGLAFALLLLVFGMVPFAILVSFRIRLPVVFILYQLLGMLLKIFGTLAIIGYLYSL